MIVDIGMHLELEIPAGTGFHEGERWTPELGLEFLLTRTITDPAHCRDEIDRYLGLARSGAVVQGRRAGLAAGRDAARRRHGAEFDFKAFHTAALNMGGMGLDPLARRLDAARCESAGLRAGRERSESAAAGGSADRARAGTAGPGRARRTAAGRR